MKPLKALGGYVCMYVCMYVPRSSFSCTRVLVLIWPIKGGGVACLGSLSVLCGTVWCSAYNEGGAC